MPIAGRRMTQHPAVHDSFLICPANRGLLSAQICLYRMHMESRSFLDGTPYTHSAWDAFPAHTMFTTFVRRQPESEWGQSVVMRKGAVATGGQWGITTWYD